MGSGDRLHWLQRALPWQHDCVNNVLCMRLERRDGR